MKKSGKVIRIPKAAARHWRKGQPIPAAMKREIERQVESYYGLEEIRLKAKLGEWQGNVTELLYAVTGFLSTREKPLTFSRYHNAAPIADIIGALVKANGLPDTTKDWPKIQIPDGIDAIENSATQVRNAVLPDLVQAKEQIMALLLSYSTPEQIMLVGAVTQNLKKIKTAYLSAVRGERDRHETTVSRAFDNLDALEKITRGDIVFIPKELE